MGASIGYRVPYQVKVSAGDLASGKPLSNYFYLKNDINAVGPQAYGTPIPGGSDIATLLAAFVTNYLATIITVMSHNYKLKLFQIRSLYGWKYGSPFFYISGASLGATTIFTTNLKGTVGTSETLSMQVTPLSGPWSVNFNTLLFATWIAPYTFSVAKNTTGYDPWPGGTIQRPTGNVQWLTGDYAEQVDTTPGGLGGDAAPLFANVDVRMTFPFTGKNWRLYNAFAPLQNAQTIDGRLTASGLTAWTTQAAALNVGILNGGSDANSKFSFLTGVSKALAFSYVSPFSQSDKWASFPSTYVPVADLGSRVRRKPKLSTAIT